MRLATFSLLGLLGGALASNTQIVLENESAPSLDTLLTVSRDLSAFSSYLRSSGSLYTRILTPVGKTTVFAPCDQAIFKLNRKPHEGPQDTDREEIADAEEDEKRNAAYLKNWLASHLVGGEVELEKLPTEVDSLTDDRRIRIETTKAGKNGWENAILQPGDARIIRRTEASDGILYVLDAVLAF